MVHHTADGFLADVQALKELLVRNAWVAMPGAALQSHQASCRPVHVHPDLVRVADLVGPVTRP